MAPEETNFRFRYTNHRGETADRCVVAQSVRFWHGATDWHPEPQMLMSAIDVDRGSRRDFAWKDVVFRNSVCTNSRQLADELRQRAVAVEAANQPLAANAMRRAADALEQAVGIQE